MRKLVPILVVAACGGSSKSEKVTVHTAGAKLAAMREGTGAWKTLTPGDLALNLHGPTAITTVCDSGFFDFYTVFVGPGSGDIEMGCGAEANIDVMLQAPASVFITIDFFPTHGGMTASTTPGIHDVVAYDTSSDPAKFEIRRDIDFRQNMTLTFDPATFTPMKAATVTIDGANDVTSQRSRLVTKNNTFVSVPSTGTKVWLFPKGSLDAADHQSVAVSASSTDNSRFAQHEVTGDETTVAISMPGYLGGATAQWTGTAPSASIQSSESWEKLYFSVNDANFDKLWDGFVFPEFGEATSITLPDPTEIPGWLPAWNLPDHVMWEWSVNASRDVGPDYQSVGKSGAF